MKALGVVPGLSATGPGVRRGPVYIASVSLTSIMAPLGQHV
jgi:hypothetical protein